MKVAEYEWELRAGILVLQKLILLFEKQTYKGCSLYVLQFATSKEINVLEKV